MSPVTLEKVSENNFAVFLALIRKLADYEHLTPPGKAEEDRLFRDCIADPPRYEAYIGSVDGKPVGYVTVYFTYSTFLALPTLFLEDLFVLKEFRRSGIGRELFCFCRAEARRRGCGRMDWQVLTWNDPAIRFYEKEGGKRLDWYVYRLDREAF